MALISKLLLLRFRGKEFLLHKCTLCFYVILFLFLKFLDCMSRLICFWERLILIGVAWVMLWLFTISSFPSILMTFEVTWQRYTSIQFQVWLSRTWINKLGWPVCTVQYIVVRLWITLTVQFIPWLSSCEGCRFYWQLEEDEIGTLSCMRIATAYPNCI